MRFAAPQYFWLLLVVIPLLTGFVIWSWRVKQRMIAQFVQSRLLANLTVGVSQPRQKLRLALLVIATAFSLIALARPQWGFAWEEAKQKGLDIVVAVDTSRSMLAEDLPPNRLSRAKLAALDLMKQAKNDRLGLVSFAGTAFLQSPLTLDEEAFRQNVEALTIGIIPEGGTALAAAIETALTAFEKANDNHKVMILFTDGEDHESDDAALAAAEKAAKAGMMIFTIGVGTPEGEMLRTKDDRGNVVFIKDEGNNAVKSRLNETLLQKIATAANGFYLPLLGANPIETLYSRGLAPLPKSDSTTMLTKVYKERYHWPLALAIGCLIAEMFIPERKSPRRAAPPTASSNSDLRNAAAIICLLLLPLAANASSSGALRLYNAGKFGPAFSEYERLSDQKTNDYRLHYNAGTAAYKAKDLEAAEKHLSAALNSPEIASDLSAQQRAYYNLGNTQFQLGAPMAEPDKKQELWESAITNFDRALKLDSKDTNANMNMAFVKKKLEELKKQQQQQQNKDGKSKDKNNKDQQQQDQKNNQDQKDQKDQQNKEDQKESKEDQKGSQKQDQNKQQQPQKSEEEKQKQQQAKAKKDKENQEEKDEAAAEQKDKSPEKGEEQSAVVAGQMTPQQAKQILDAEQQDEKALIFSPGNDPSKPKIPQKKDW